jgi:hypothetical protein
MPQSPAGPLDGISRRRSQVMSEILGYDEESIANLAAAEVLS